MIYKRVNLPFNLSLSNNTWHLLWLILDLPSSTAFQVSCCDISFKNVTRHFDWPLHSSFCHLVTLLKTPSPLNNHWFNNNGQVLKINFVRRLQLDGRWFKTWSTSRVRFRHLRGMISNQGSIVHTELLNLYF
jgi:hypothetical protein